MEYRKIEEFEFLKILSDAGYINGMIETQEKLINAIGDFESLEILRKELAKSIKVVLNGLLNAESHS